jgi:hypothetical protein
LTAQHGIQAAGHLGKANRLGKHLQRQIEITGEGHSNNRKWQVPVAVPAQRRRAARRDQFTQEIKQHQQRHGLDDAHQEACFVTGFNAEIP